MRDLSQLSEVVVLAIKAAQAPLLAQLATAEQRMKDLEARLLEQSPIRDRVAALEIKAGMPPAPDAALAELRDRIVALELKAVPASDDTDLLDILHRLRTVEAAATAWEAPAAKTDTHLDNLTKDLGALRERVAVVEVRPLMPGPQGPAGTAGRDGTNGRDGLDGFGFDDIGVALDENTKNFIFSFTKGDRVKVFPLFVPYMRYRGVYKESEVYLKGDGTTWGGGISVANDEIKMVRPGDGNKWTLAVKPGRDGRDGVDAPTVPVVKVAR